MIGKMEIRGLYRMSLIFITPKIKNLLPLAHPKGCHQTALTLSIASLKNTVQKITTAH
jgi:hypothetical protein